MGGSNSTTISGMRFHVNDSEGTVHIHDDSASLKFSLDKKSFKREMQEALESLEKVKRGVVTVEGKTSTSFYIMSEGGSYSMFLSDGSNNRNKIEEFLRSC
jgi:hypothetical protein